MTKSERETQKLEAIKQLREYLPAGSTVYTILRDVSRSGMSRRISVVAMAHTFKKVQCSCGEDAEQYFEDLEECYPLHITHLVSQAIGWRIKTGFNDALVVSGCGMDMGEHLVQTLSYALYGNSHSFKQAWL